MKRLFGIVVAMLYGGSAFALVWSTGMYDGFARDPWLSAASLVVCITAAVSLAYISTLLMVFLTGRSPEPGDPEAFDWHLLVPCRDEESVIAATVSAARSSFPGAHLWIIDDASDDGTASVVRRLMEFDDRIHLISRVRPDARLGKGEALNDAYRTVSARIGDDPEMRRRTVIGVLDADGYLSDNALAAIAGPDAFGDSRVGAVQIEVWMKNRNDMRPLPGRGRIANAFGRYLVRMQDVEFRTTNSAMQLFRVQTGSVGMGGNGQFTRLDALDAVAERFGAPWGRKLSEDYELGLHILELGYRNHYTRAAHVSQEALPYGRRLLTQRTRWAQGIMECASILPALRRSRTVRPLGLLEVNFFMSQPLLMMLNLILLPILIVTAVVRGQFGTFDVGTTASLVAALLAYLILPYAVWGPIYRHIARDERRVRTGVLVGLGMLIYVYATYLYYPRAIGRMLTGRNAWAKTKRNADDVVPVPTAVSDRLLTVPLVDPVVLEDLAGELDQRNDLALEFVAAFAVMWPTRLARISAAIDAEDTVAGRDAAESIRVSATMVGAGRLSLVGSEMTDLVRAGDFEYARRRLQLLSDIGTETVDEFRTNYLAALKGID
ncbi:glycosyltransferase [Spelaeicoccus albus]|uniref:Cellulose synthase/poly-beta-1,6-N-acetylglucosamine synthase-like glycosyltransferase n=1 Tax=Spelaeicoccus albus TaxID=1280376 RepID=A0A7Z0D2A9_9MICO|nr:glycosyltransferase [Spelaeicoccus albus]NYI67572.1 cellulose synthase/poly-beta-1,6-N-acetylglucosamine synthase-like glycosyltransferase [Spelaeicoccus albus]